MTHKEIYYKLIKYNHKKYLLLLLCNSILIGTCLFFSCMLNNDLFMDASVVDPMISSNILLPTFVTFTFAIFFVVYSYTTFNRKRQKEYGVLLTIGIDANEIRKIIILENTLVAGVSIAVGFVIGTILYQSFILVSNMLIHIPGLQNGIVLEGYKAPFLYFIALFFVVILISAIVIPQKRIKALLVSDVEIRKGKSNNKYLFFAGLLAFLIVTIYIFVSLEQNKSNLLMLCYGVESVALFLMVYNSIWIIDYIKQRHTLTYFRNMVTINNIENRYAINKRILFVSIVLLGMVMFFQTFSIAEMRLGERDVEKSNPYDIAYCEFNDDVYPNEEQINEIAKENGIVLNMNKEIRYFYDDTQKYAIIPANEFGDSLRNEIKPGECIVFSQYDIYDGYPHYDKPEETDIVVKGGIFCVDYNVKKIINDVIINDAALDTEYCALISTRDYSELKRNQGDLPSGTVRLLNCGNLEQSEKLCQVLCDAFPDIGENWIAAKYIEAKNNEQSMTFLLYTLTIMDTLLLFLDVVMIHFKLYSSLQADRQKYLSMWQMGIDKRRIKKSIREYTTIFLMLPTLIATIVGGLFIVSLMRLSLLGMHAFKCSCIVGITMLAIQGVITIVYSNRYARAIEYTVK